MPGGPAGVPDASVPMHECQRGTWAAGAEPTHTNTHTHAQIHTGKHFIAGIIL